MSNEEYILAHREEDVRRLALKRIPEGVDAVWCLQQIEGWQLARKKLPRWAATEGIWFPPRLSMEQCSSEATAQYKCSIVEHLLPTAEERDTMADITGGFGIDFSYMAQGFRHATYVERLPHLCDLARHNIELIQNYTAKGLGQDKQLPFSIQNTAEDNVQNTEYRIQNTTEDNVPSSTFSIQNCNADEFLSLGGGGECYSLLFLDPARRDNVGRKVAALEDCTPNVVEMRGRLLTHARFVMLKLSPMLDITQAIRQLNSHSIHQRGASNDDNTDRQYVSPTPCYNNVVKEVHVVSVQGECKEVLLVLSRLPFSSTGITYHCVNLNTPDSPFLYHKESSDNPSAPLLSFGSGKDCADTLPAPILPLAGREDLAEWFLYEPNASILKAGVQDALCQRYNVVKLHPLSNLFVSQKQLEGFPGRAFQVVSVCDFSKRELKTLLGDLKQANLAIRNFPSTVAELRKRLKLKEGGDAYLFATTLSDGAHCIIRCKKCNAKMQK